MLLIQCLCAWDSRIQSDQLASGSTDPPHLPSSGIEYVSPRPVSILMLEIPTQVPRIESGPLTNLSTSETGDFKLN